MASIKLKHSGGNGVIIAAPSSNPASDRTITLPSTADGTMLTTTNPKAGNIIQVVQTLKEDTFSTTSTSFVDFTGINVSITPSSSSNKILILISVNIACGGTNADKNATFQLLRGSSVIHTCMSQRQANISTNTYFNMRGNVIFLDSPNTTSSTTYKMQGKLAGTGTLTVNDDAVGDCTVTAMEIAA